MILQHEIISTLKLINGRSIRDADVMTTTRRTIRGPKRECFLSPVTEHKISGATVDLMESAQP